MWNVLRAIYDNVSCCTGLNGFSADWFSVKCGVKQGCVLPSLLFKLFINDLAAALTSVCKGDHNDNDVICVLMYADDIVILALTIICH